MLFVEEPRWWKYATHDEYGIVNGVREDTPEDIKKEYYDYLKKREARNPFLKKEK